MTPYLFCVGWVVVQWVVGMSVIHSPDSAGYIYFDITRTVGYPLFLSLVQGVTGSYQWLPHIQLALLWASIAYVAHGLPNWSRWPWVLGMAVVSYVMKQCYCMEIMTEPLFITLLLTCAGCMLHHASLIWLSLCVGALILIRPSGYALLPALAIYTWHQRASWWKFAVPLACCLAIGVGVQTYRNGVLSTQSFLGHNLIGKVAFTVRTDMHSSDPKREAFIQRMGVYMKSIQNMVQFAPSHPIKYFLAAPTYDIVRFKKLGSFEENLDIPLKQCDAFWRNTALEIIRQNPIGYIQDVWMNWMALWFLWDVLPEDQRILRSEYAQKVHDRCQDIVFKRFEYMPRWPLMVNTLRFGLSIILMLSLWAIWGTRWWCRRHDEHPHVMVMCTLSLFLHGSILLTALVQAGLPRYVLIFWPYFWLLTLLWIGIAYDKYRRTRSML